MADEKISQLPDGSSLQAADLLVVARSGANYSLSGTEIGAGFQPVDADLTAIAALDSSTAGAIASDGSGWIKKTYAQFKTALSLVKGDVGLGNVDNTADSAKVVASAAILTTARTIDGVSFDGSANITTLAEATHAATSKATPVDADELPLVDSAASNVLKKLTWANLKATLKTYFDGIYLALTGSVGSAAMAGWTVNAQTNTTYTLALTDAFKIVTLNNAGAVTLTIPANSSVAFPVGTEIPCTGIGAGLVTVAAAGGVTINNPTNASLLLAQYQIARLVKIATDTWEVNKGSRPPDGSTLTVNASGQLGVPTGGIASAQLANAIVTNAKMENMAQKTVKMRHTASTGSPEDTSMANLWTDLSGQAGASVGMNSQKLTNLAAGSGAGDSLRYEQLFTAGAVPIADIADPTTGKVIGSASNAAAAVFPPGYEIGYDQITTTSITVSSTTEGTPTTIMAGSSHAFDGSPVLLEFFCPRAAGGSVGSVVVLLMESGSSLGRIGFVPANVTTGVCFHYRFTPSAGNHTYGVSAFTGTTGNGLIQSGAAGSGVETPSFIRFTKV